MPLTVVFTRRRPTVNEVLYPFDDMQRVLESVTAGLYVFVILQIDKDNPNQFKNDYYCKLYRKDGVLCGGAVTDRRYIGGRLFVRYAYRLPNRPAIAYVKDFEEAPKELEHYHRNIVIVLVPERLGRSPGIHYGVMQKLNAAELNKSKKAFRTCCIVSFTMLCFTILNDTEPILLIELPSCVYLLWYIQLYSCLYVMWRVQKRLHEAIGITTGVWKTLKRTKWRLNHPRRNRMIQSMLRKDLKSVDMDYYEDVFLALESSELKFVKIMKSLDPIANVGVTTFRCDKYFSYVPACQLALQNDDSAHLNRFDTIFE